MTSGLLNTQFNNLAKRILAHDEYRLQEVQNCAIRCKPIQDKLSLRRYMIECVGCESGLGEVLVHLDQKGGPSVAGECFQGRWFRPNFRCWIARMQSGIYSVIKVNGQISVVGNWTDGSKMFFGIWLEPEIQVCRNWNKMMSSLVQKQTAKKCSLKCCAIGGDDCSRQTLEHVDGLPLEVPRATKPCCSVWPLYEPYQFVR